MEPLRDIKGENVTKINEKNLREVVAADFEKAIKFIAPSVSRQEIEFFESYGKKFDEKI